MASKAPLITALPTPQPKPLTTLQLARTQLAATSWMKFCASCLVHSPYSSALPEKNTVRFRYRASIFLILLCHKCGIMNPPNSFCEGR